MRSTPWTLLALPLLLAFGLAPNAFGQERTYAVSGTQNDASIDGTVTLKKAGDHWIVNVVDSTGATYQGTGITSWKKTNAFEVRVADLHRTGGGGAAPPKRGATSILDGIGESRRPDVTPDPRLKPDSTPKKLRILVSGPKVKIRSYSATNQLVGDTSGSLDWASEVTRLEDRLINAEQNAREGGSPELDQERRKIMSALEGTRQRRDEQDRALMTSDDPADRAEAVRRLQDRLLENEERSRAATQNGQGPIPHVLSAEHQQNERALQEAIARRDEADQKQMESANPEDQAAVVTRLQDRLLETEKRARAEEQKGQGPAPYVLSSEHQRTERALQEAIARRDEADQKQMESANPADQAAVVTRLQDRLLETEKRARAEEQNGQGPAPYVLSSEHQRTERALQEAIARRDEADQKQLESKDAAVRKAAIARLEARLVSIDTRIRSAQGTDGPGAPAPTVLSAERQRTQRLLDSANQQNR